jgi:hypothetical protein
LLVGLCEVDDEALCVPFREREVVVVGELQLVAHQADVAVLWAAM